MLRHLGKRAAETSTTKHSLRKHAKVTTSSYEQQRGEYNEARDVRITTNGDEITLDELHRSPNGGWFTIKSTVTIAHVDLRRYLYRRCVECRKKAIQNAEGKYCCVEHPEADTKQTYCLRVLLKQDEICTWSTAFDDVAELIMGIPVEDFDALNDVGKKTIIRHTIDTKYNVTITKQIGRHTNYIVKSMQPAGLLS